ncbi:MAG TPA: FHA domain-containing protein [Kofleriaceae bacterium]|nr:FHA domain-containing protein [Kofleriaceae bacterium]
MPKASSSFAQDDEDEKTTIESGWEDEASTTVEQGEVAEKVRSALDVSSRTHGQRSSTSITSRHGSVVEDPTADDQRVNAAMAMMSSVAPARIVVTSGNDKGQELEVRPGKTFTIGRAIDNDLVLTDIAVSRKHFDLRHENGAWIVVDRGSGNGTVVNGTIEDQPFVLMNGDAIEIGNTAFRFEHPDQPSRSRGYDDDQPSRRRGYDDDEPSTVAGKPVRHDEPPPALLPPPSRAPTQPPPAPPHRARPPSVAPAPMQLDAQIATPSALTTTRAASAPAPRQPSPAMLDSGTAGQRPLHHDLPHPPGMLPTTLPGQGPPVAPSQPQVAFGYPSVGDMHPQQLAQLQISGNVPRDATSTAHVPPAPYDASSQDVAVAQPQPALTRRIKLLLGGALLMVVAAIGTIAIIKGSSSNAKPAAKATDTAAVHADTSTKPAHVSVQPIEPKPDAPLVKPPDDAAEQTKLDDARRAAEQKKLDDAEAEAEERRLAEQKKKKAERKKLEDERRAEEADVASAKAEQKKRDEAAELARKKAEQASAPTAPKPTPRPPKVTAAKEPTVAAAQPTTKKPADLSGVKSKAENLYRAKKFGEAAQTLRAGAGGLGEADARELRSLAGVYEQVGKAYNVGMGPATPASEAFTSLERALNLDRPSGVFTDELKTKLGLVAPRAATKYMVDKNYELAFKAVRVAESNGGGNTTTQAVRSALVDAANELYSAAMAEKDENPSAAKQKLQRIKSIVDGKPAVLAKAEKALRELTGK